MRHVECAAPRSVCNLAACQRARRLNTVGKAVLINNRRLIRALASGDDRERLQEVTRRAAELRGEQQELGALVTELGASFDALPARERQAVLRALGLPPAVVAAVGEEGPVPGSGLGPMSSTAEVAMRVARITDPQQWAQPDEAEMKRMAAEAEALARRLEEGEPLPPPPPGELVGPPEDADKFLARMRESVARFEARVAGKPAKWGADSALPAGSPATTAAEHEWHGPFSNVPVFPRELVGTLPAPERPAQEQAQWQHAQRITYVLRRAHLRQEPTAALEALRAKGLVADDLVFDDPWLTLVGAGQALQYLGRIEAAGGRFELDSVFLTCEQYDPPQFRVVADVFLNFPLPTWYLNYLALHGQQRQVTEPPPRQRGAYGQPGSALPAGGIYPRRDTALSQAEMEGTAHMPWLRWPHPLASAPQLMVKSPNGAASLEGAAPRTWALPSPAGTAASWSSRPSYAALPSGDCILDSVRWQQEGQPAATPTPFEAPSPPLPRPAPANLERDPLTPEEAEYLLRLLLGDKFEAAMAQLPTPGKGPPKKRRSGMEWQGGEVLTVALTLAYEIDAAARQVATVTAHWDGVGGPFSDAFEAYDVLLAECGMLTWNIDIEE